MQKGTNLLLFLETKYNKTPIEGLKEMKSMEALEKKLKELDEKIKDAEGRLPAHSVKPPIMTELFDLEDEREAILAQLKALRSEKK